MNKGREEPPDYFDHGIVSFNRDTFEFFFAAVRFYETVLSKGLNAIKNDEDLKTILGDDALATFPIAKELERTRRAGEWFSNQISIGGGIEIDVGVGVSHGLVRYIKSVAILYLEHLQGRRNALASRRDFPKGLLQAVDQQMSKYEEKLSMGIFREATPAHLILADVPEAREESPPEAAGGESVSRELRPSPVVHDSIEILDTELRKRCLDLFALFREDGACDRLDTVLSEATRILEDRLRSLSGAPATCTGVKLADYAFSTAGGRLIVSEIDAEQEAARFLYRGLFGFIRNSVHHRLVENLQPERVLQIVGMIDYFISVAESARRVASPDKPDPGRGKVGDPSERL